MKMMIINPLERFFGIKGQVALDINLGPGYNTLLLRLIPRDLYRKFPLESSTHYLAFYPIVLYCQTTTLMPVCQVGRQFVPFS